MGIYRALSSWIWTRGVEVEFGPILLSSMADRYLHSPPRPTACLSLYLGLHS